MDNNSKPLWLFQQSAVLPWRIKEQNIEILLISTRSKKGWTVPKGVLEFGYTPWESALKEAREEAGIDGRVSRNCLGDYVYKKWGGTCHVDVYAMEVQRLSVHWPEMLMRRRKWFSLRKAAKKVKHKGLIPVLELLPRYLKSV